MSVTNAISGMVAVGGVFIMGGGWVPHTIPQAFAALAVLLANVNIFGGVSSIPSYGAAGMLTTHRSSLLRNACWICSSARLTLRNILGCTPFPVLSLPEVSSPRRRPAWTDLSKQDTLPVAFSVSVSATRGASEFGALTDDLHRIPLRTCIPGHRQAR